jgi:hypothetical protein
MKPARRKVAEAEAVVEAVAATVAEEEAVAATVAVEAATVAVEAADAAINTPDRTTAKRLRGDGNPSPSFVVVARWLFRPFLFRYDPRSELALRGSYH